MAADPLASSSKSPVLQKFEKLAFIQRDILGGAVDNDNLFMKYSFLLLFNKDEIDELRGYVLDEMLYRGLLARQTNTKVAQYRNCFPPLFFFL